MISNSHYHHRRPMYDVIVQTLLSLSARGLGLELVLYSSVLVVVDSVKSLGGPGGFLLPSASPGSS